MAEAEVLEEQISLGNVKKRAGQDGPGLGFENQTREQVAALTGVGSGRTYEKMRRVWNEAKINPNIMAKVEKIDKGETSLESVYKLVTGKIDEAGTVIEFEPRVYNSWSFGMNDPRFGVPYPGRIPGQIVQNFVYYYTDPGQVVVDPMAGGGTTVDVCHFMGRRCLAYDMDPQRPDISQHNISEGFPEESHG